VKNSDYEYNLEPNSDPPEWPPKSFPVFHAKTAFELKYPYTTEELADEIEKGINAWNRLEPYTSKRGSIEEYYYKISGFKKATLGKKLIEVNLDRINGNRVSIMLPVKAGKYYLGMTHISLAEDADWLDFAKAVIELVEMDITKVSAYKTFKRKLNI